MNIDSIHGHNMDKAVSSLGKMNYLKGTTSSGCDDLYRLCVEIHHLMYVNL